jgi:hypothetical protein
VPTRRLNDLRGNHACQIDLFKFGVSLVTCSHLALSPSLYRPLRWHVTSVLAFSFYSKVVGEPILRQTYAPIHHFRPNGSAFQQTLQPFSQQPVATTPLPLTFPPTFPLANRPTASTFPAPRGAEIICYGCGEKGHGMSSCSAINELMTKGLRLFAFGMVHRSLRIWNWNPALASGKLGTRSYCKYIYQCDSVMYIFRELRQEVTE